MLRSRLKSLVSNDTIKDHTDLREASEETLQSAKDKLAELMTKMKNIRSSVTIRELKDKIEAQIHRIQLIEKYLLTNPKKASDAVSDNVDFRYHSLHDCDAKKDCKDSINTQQSDAYIQMTNPCNSVSAISIRSVFNKVQCLLFFGVEDLD